MIKFKLKKTVLFLNGWGNPKDHSINFLEIFKKYYPGRVISYDYMGKTDNALQDLRKIKADIVIGYSFGGYLAEKLDIPERILVCPLLSFGKEHAKFLGISYPPLISKSGNGKTIGYFGGLDNKVTEIDRKIFKRKYGEYIFLPEMKHKPSIEFWKILAKEVSQH